jgi:hypothetical protein
MFSLSSLPEREEQDHAPFGYLNSDLAHRWSGYGVFDRMRKEKGQPTTAATSLSAATSAATTASSCAYAGAGPWLTILLKPAIPA